MSSKIFWGLIWLGTALILPLIFGLLVMNANNLGLVLLLGGTLVAICNFPPKP
jgi:hypothetical protein